jgi:hypothetical protein
MPGINLPPDRGSIVKNTEGRDFADSHNTGPTNAGPFSITNLDAPSDDAAKISRGISSDHGGKGMSHGKTIASDSLHPALDVRSIPTQQLDAPQNDQTWNSGDKGTNWMGRGSYPTGNEVPKVPSGSNKRTYRPQGR